MALTIDAPTATVIVAVIVAVTQVWQTFIMLHVRTLVNSNFTEAKLARLTAETALKTSQELNLHLQQQLDNRLAGPTGATGQRGAIGATGPIGETGKTGKTGGINAD